MLTVKELHERTVYPMVRVIGKGVGGSGTVVYSKPNEKGKVETYILTCDHVIEGLRSYPTEFDAWRGRDVNLCTRFKNCAVSILAQGPSQMVTAHSYLILPPTRDFPFFVFYFNLRGYEFGALTCGDWRAHHQPGKQQQ